MPGDKNRVSTFDDGWAETLRGWSSLKVWVRGGEMIISGRPPRMEDGYPEDAHNCDAMGCGWEHVAARGAVPRIVEGMDADVAD